MTSSSSMAPGATASTPKVYIILVNWNGWRDTIECLESLLRLDYPNFSVVVCDNQSSDGSVERIRNWAEGSLRASCANPALQSLTNPPFPKPVSYYYISARSSFALAHAAVDAAVILIETGVNLGFAAGNNVGLRYALMRADFAYAWLLNNDTVVARDALRRLVERMNQRPEAGMCGSTLLYYGHPTVVQAMGGSIYSRWTARGGHIGLGDVSSKIPPADRVESQMKYVLGASMLVSRNFIEHIGLMNESYFLYFEEIDWATRAKDKFALAYAPRSIVYHKEGGSIGTAVERSKRSPMSEYYAARSSLLFSRRYSRAAIPVVVSLLLFRSILRYFAGSPTRGRAVFRGIRDAFRKELPAR